MPRRRFFHRSCIKCQIFSIAEQHVQGILLVPWSGMAHDLSFSTEFLAWSPDFGNTWEDVFDPTLFQTKS